jgi:hypothetical protein
MTDGKECRQNDLLDPTRPSESRLRRAPGYSSGWVVNESG